MSRKNLRIAASSVPQNRDAASHGLSLRKPVQKHAFAGKTHLKSKALEVFATEPAGQEENPQQNSGDVDPSTNFLGIYFRDMSHLSTLNPEEEKDLAQQLQQLEIERWSHLLSFSPIHAKVAELLEKNAKKLPAEYTTWRQEGTMSGNQSPALKQVAQALAEKLHKADIDRLWIGESLAVFHAWVHEGKLGSWQQAMLDLEAIHKQAEHTKNEFVEANLRLVVSIARRFYQGKMSLADLIQEGNIGLIKAVERFDYHLGYRFSTYASWWIRHAISRAVADKGRAVRVPVHMIDTYYRLVRSKRDLANTLGRQPTNEELSHAADVSMEKIEKMNAYLLEYSFSIDQSFSDDDKRQFVDLIEDDSPAGHPMEQMVEKTIHSEVETMMAQLSPLEADILRQRFGLNEDSEEEHTLSEIGKKYHLSRERIRQIQEHALHKMRHVLEEKDLL